MPFPSEDHEMVKSDWPGANSCREEATGQPARPRRDAVPGTDPPVRLAKFHAPEILFGSGALAELGHCAARLGARRPFLVTDPGLIETGWADEAIGYLRQGGLGPAVWHDVTPNPKDHEIEAAFQRYIESGSDVIVGLGGGSCIDAAKGVAILIRFNAQAWPQRFVPLAEAAGISTEGVAAQEVALILAERVRELADEVGVPRGLTALGVTEAVLPRLARTTLKDVCLATNPREADARDIEAIFRAAL
jgi:alcohol dehydrogenase class IV